MAHTVRCHGFFLRLRLSGTADTKAAESCSQKYLILPCSVHCLSNSVVRVFDDENGWQTQTVSEYLSLEHYCVSRIC